MPPSANLEVFAEKQGTDLAGHSLDDLSTVAHELNDRPRKSLDWDTPAERMTALLGAS